MKKKRFFKDLIQGNLQKVWLSEYNIEVARDVIRESIKRIPYLDEEIKRWEKRQKELGGVDVKEGMMKEHYEKLRIAKDTIRDLRKEIEIEENNRKSARVNILEYKGKIIEFGMKIEAQIKHLKSGKFKYEDKIDIEPKVEDSKPKSESK